MVRTCGWLSWWGCGLSVLLWLVVVLLGCRWNGGVVGVVGVVMRNSPKKSV